MKMNRHDTKALMVLITAVFMMSNALAGDIISLKDGYLTFLTPDTNLYYTVEARPNIMGSYEDWDGIYRIRQDIRSTNSMVTVPVGFFYRIVANPQPLHTRTISPGSTEIAAGYYEATTLDGVDPNLSAANILAGSTLFGIEGTVLQATGDATAAEVLTGRTFSRMDAVDVSGTMPNRGDQGFMPGVADVTIPAGYYSGAGVVTGDAALVSGNIRGGATLFGVGGKPEVVDTEGATAVAADLMEDKVAFVAGSVVTGTIATITLSDTTTVVQAGYIAATNLALVDADLTAANIREGVTIFGVAGTGVKSGMALIPAGDFVKTDHPDGSNWTTNYISAFYLSRTHITKAQWDAVRSWASTNEYTDLPVGGGKDVDHPVQQVNWYDVVKWCNARSEMEGRTPAYYTDGTHATVYRIGNLDLTNACVAWTTGGYRLPTESEWEKAARGGLEAHRFPWAHTWRTNQISHFQANFWNGGGEAYQYGTTGFHPDYNDGTVPYTSPVGSFAPNGYGLYDMSGNVWDWCWDWHGAAGGYYVAGSDLRGPDTGSDRVLRGGSWGSGANRCRSAYRDNYSPSGASYRGGFRVVLPPGQ